MLNIFTRRSPKIDLDRKVTLDHPDRKLILSGELALILEWQITDKNGNLIPERSFKKRAESFTVQFIEMLRIAMDWTAYKMPYWMKDIHGDMLPIAGNCKLFTSTAPIAEVEYGIVVGTGSTTPTITDYQLGARIAHGTGTGQVQYGNNAFGLPTTTSSTSSFTLVRAFSNVSGATITVYEIGAYVRTRIAFFGADQEVTNYGDFCIIRDVISGGISLLNGETLTINYRYQGAV